MSQQAKLPVHSLPLPANPLQSSLTRLKLDNTPTSQRRSTTFPKDTRGIWARVHPLWAAWPLRITREEVEEMGIDIQAGGQVTADDVLARYEPQDIVSTHDNGLRVMTSKQRSKLEPFLLGVSQSALEASLPHLDVGDAVALCNNGAEEAEEGTEEGKARKALEDILSGRHLLVSNPEQGGKEYGPWSTRYCGHQFGSWAGQLGDGRATSLFETQLPDGTRTEVQLKGAGRTPFSRTADGLAVLRSGVREFLGCEAVAALGIPATRSLALLTLDEKTLPVVRENGPEPTSLLARLAPTFIRIGHFEALNPSPQARKFSQIYFGGGWMRGDESEDGEDGPLEGQGNLEGLRELVEWCKGVMGYQGDTAGWVKEVVRRNAEMVAGWQVNGWMHGVLNTDNISVLGLTIDFGPYAFMDVWDEGHICNHSDPSGLYSYRRQPERVLFALDKLVAALSPVIGYEALHGTPQAGWSEGKTKEDVEQWNDKTTEVMKDWPEAYWSVEREGERRGWLKRFGLKTHKETDDRDIFYDYLTLLRSHNFDFHSSLRLLTTFSPSKADSPKYTRPFASNMVAECTIDLRAESVEKAIQEVEGWLSLYAARVNDEAEVDAWKAEGEEWEAKRKQAMEGVNPRFVLRQWVLEELIAELEGTGVKGIKDGRAKLARVLDMSINPFRAYQQDGTEEARIRSRLCGLGGKDMLGFQCSCSS